MNAGDDETMRALDHRLRKLLSGLDATQGFEDRLQARIATLAATRSARPADAVLAKLERERDRACAAAARAAQADAVAIAIAGVGGLVAVWRFAPALTQLYSASLQVAGPTVIGFATMAATGAALWALLRRFDVNPRTLAGA